MMKAYILVAALLGAASANAANDNIINSDNAIADSVDLQTVVVTGTKTPKTLDNTPIVTRVITAEDIKKLDATDIRDVLRQEMPGIEFGYAMNQQVSLDMNGFGGNSVLFLVDGERLAGETMNNIDYSRLNMDNVERIEIVRGAASSLYGSNAVGGVVNIITKKSVGKWAANVNAHWGEYGEQRYGGSYSFNKSKWFSLTNVQHSRMNTIRLKNDGDFSQIYGNKSWNFKEKLVYNLNERMKLTGRAGYFFRQRDASADIKDRYRDFSGGLKGDYKITDNDNVELSYSFDQYDKSDYYRENDKDIRDYSNVQHIVRALYNHSFSEKTILTVGGDFMRDYLMSYQFENNGSRHQQSVDGFAQIDFSPIDKVTMVGGVRYDYFSASGKSRLSPKLDVMYKPVHEIALRASYAGGFRAPTLKEMYMNFNMANVFNIYGNEDLKSECSDNFQLSAEYRHRNYDFTVGGFHNIVRNGITTVWSDALDGMQYMNIERYNTTGVTANAVAQWSNGLGARVAYTYTHLDNKQHEAQYFPTRPHALTCRVEYGHDWKHYGFNVALSGRFLSSSSTTTLDDSNKPKTTHYPSYSIYKLTLIQHVLKGIDVTMVVDNLFNYRPKYYYSNSPTTNGATFSAGVSIDIDKFFK